MAKILIKNGQNGCFLENVWPKIENVLTMVIYILLGVLKCSEGRIFSAEKIWF